MKTKTLKSLVCLLLLIVLGGEVLLSAFPVSAASSVGSFDDSPIEQDLLQNDLSMYPKNEGGDCELITMMEYAFSDFHDYSRVYNLYFYVYNPTEKPIYTLGDYNVVNIATVYTYQDGVPKVARKENLILEYVDKTDNNRFYKFKLRDSGAILDLAKECSFNFSGTRRYSITGIQLAHSPGVPIDYEVTRFYDWSGYAALCDPEKSTDVTLKSYVTGDKSIHLELNYTNYRFANKIDNMLVKPWNTLADDLSSVYFSIPEEYFQTWGKLSEIEAEWYEYLTSPMFVTSDSGAYSGLWDMRGKRINEFGQLIDENGNVIDSSTQSYWRVFWYITGGAGNGDAEFGIKNTFNGKCRDDVDDDRFWLDNDGSKLYTFGSYENGYSGEWFVTNELLWLFYVEGVTGDDGYRVSSDEVRKYMESYTKSFPSEDLIRGYAASLFDLTPSDKYTIGYNSKTFLVENSEQLKDANKDQTAWNKFWNGTEIVDITYSPIAFISEGDLVLGDSEFSEKYYVNLQDVSDVKDYARKAFSNGERPLLLRFAKRDYEAHSAMFDFAEENKFDLSGNDGYVAQEHVFLDFDIISLTFKDLAGTETVIGAVCIPIDVINGLTPPEGLVQEQEWWQILVALLGLVVLLLLLSFAFPFVGTVFNVVINGASFIVKGVFGIVSLPFRLLFWRK